MLSISHGLTGAFFAAQLQDPILFGPVALFSHYLEDWIPHWDMGTGLSSGKRTRSTAIILGSIDLAIACGAIFLLWGSPTLTNIHVWVGAFIGLLPDFLEAPRNFLHWEPNFLKPINKFHSMFHYSIPYKVLGLVPQIMLWGMIVLLTIG